MNRHHQSALSLLAGFGLVIAGIVVVGLGGTNGFPILTPKPPRAPRINGPAVYGARPGDPFLFHIPCTGERPIRFAAKRLPAGLSLDAATGIITDRTPAKGQCFQL